MKVLKTRLYRKKGTQDRYVDVYVNGRWWTNRECRVDYPCSTVCGAHDEDFEFVQLESLEDCEVIQVAEPFLFHIAIGDVFRRCTFCGRYENTGYGYRPRGSSIPLAMGNPRWAAPRI